MTTTEVRMVGCRERIGPGVVMLRNVGSGAARPGDHGPGPRPGYCTRTRLSQSAAACVPAPQA